MKTTHIPKLIDTSLPLEAINEALAQRGALDYDEVLDEVIGRGF